MTVTHLGWALGDGTPVVPLNRFADILSVLRADLRATALSPTSACPTDGEIDLAAKAFYSAAGASQRVTPALQRVVNHAAECPHCFKRMLTWASRDAGRVVHEAAASLQEVADDADALAGIATDLQRPSWFRALAAEHLGDLYGRSVWVTIEALTRDTDEEVREIAAITRARLVRKRASALRHYDHELRPNRLRFAALIDLAADSCAPAALPPATPVGERVRRATRANWRLTREGSELQMEVTNLRRRQQGCRLYFVLETPLEAGLRYLGKVTTAALFGTEVTRLRLPEDVTNKHEPDSIVVAFYGPPFSDARRSSPATQAVPSASGAPHHKASPPA